MIVLNEIYNKKTLFVVIFASKEYANKVWTNHERESAQARAIEESREYILPVKFDDTNIPGLLNTTGFISASDKKPEEISNLIIKKILSYKKDKIA